MQTAAPPLPTRSKRRWFFVGGFMLFVLATPYLWLLIAGTWRDHELEQIYREMDSEDPNWRWADLVRQLPPAPPDERNAMVQATKVSAMIKASAFGNGPFASKAPRPINARLRDADEQRLRAALALLTPAILGEAYKLKDMPEGGIRTDPSASPLQNGQDCLEIMTVTRVLQQDLMLNANGGKLDEAADACLAIAHCAHAIGDFPTLFPQLVRRAAQDQAVEAIARTLAQGIVDEERLAAIQTALTLEADHNGAYHALRGEREFGRHCFLAIRDGDPAGEEIIDAMRRQMGTPGRLYALFPAMLLRGYPDRLRLQNAMVRASLLKDEANIQAFEELQVTKPDVLNPLNNGDFIVQSQIVEQRLANTRVRCAVAAVAAERYRLKHDRWPTGVAELVKDGFLKQPITDPYDGKALRFQRTDAGLIVHSVGRDKIDNQGKKDDIGFELWLPHARATEPKVQR